MAISTLSKIMKDLIEEVEESRRTDITYLYIRIIVGDGGREHTHHCLIETKCEDVTFAVRWYLAHYWGHAQYSREDRVFWVEDEITLDCETFTELTYNEYKYLTNILEK